VPAQTGATSCASPGRVRHGGEAGPQLGIPLKVAWQGIDRYVDRSSARGMRRRPVRVEFCEADVLDAFDAWRRAVGIHRADGGAAGEASDEAGRPPGEETPRTRGRESLSTHLDRVIVRLTSLRAGTPRKCGMPCSRSSCALSTRCTRRARRARGEAEGAHAGDLEALMRASWSAARSRRLAQTCWPKRRARRAWAYTVRRHACPPAAYSAAHRRCELRALRERLALPTLTLD